MIKFVFILVTLTSTTLLTSATIIVVKDKSDLYIRITKIEWLETAIGSGDTYADFTFYSSIEIWNRMKENVTIATAHWHLITISIMASLDNKSLEFIYSDLFIGIINTHTIEPGVSLVEKSSVYEIKNYNQSNPPDGEYTVLAEFDGETDYEVNIYKTTIRVKEGETTITYQHTPSIWGSTQYWTPVVTILLSSGLCLVGVLVLLMLYTKRKNLISKIDKKEKEKKKVI